MPKSSPEGTPTGDKGPGSWALHIRGAAWRTRCRVLRKERVHELDAQPGIEMPTIAAELIIMVVSDQFGEPLQRTFPEG
jgi:hypothetical protein